MSTKCGHGKEHLHNCRKEKRLANTKPYLYTDSRRRLRRRSTRTEALCISVEYKRSLQHACNECTGKLLTERRVSAKCETGKKGNCECFLPRPVSVIFSRIEMRPSEPAFLRRGTADRSSPELACDAAGGSQRLQPWKP